MTNLRIKKDVIDPVQKAVKENLLVSIKVLRFTDISGIIEPKVLFYFSKRYDFLVVKG